MLLTPSRPRYVTRLRATVAEDSYGDPVTSWEYSERFPFRAEVQAVSSTDAEGSARVILRDERALFAPGAPDLRHDDRVEVDGEVWRVDGDPLTFSGGLASPVYTTATLRRFEARS